MNDLHTMFHSWGYVIISYGLVLLCWVILAAGGYLRYKQSLKRLHSLESVSGNSSSEAFEDDPLQQQGTLS